MTTKKSATSSMRYSVLLFIITSATLSAANLKVKLGLTPGETLPGIPVTMDLTLANLGAKDIAVSSRVVFAVTSTGAGTERFSVEIPRQFWNGEIEPSGKYVVPAGGEIHLFMPVTENFDSPLFAREEVNQPGEYDVVATVNGTSGTSGDSNSVHLRVTTPTGDDAIIWKALHGDVTGVAVRVACGTIVKYPASRYYQLVSPFCVPFSTLDQYSHDVLENASRLPGAYQDAVRFAVAGQYLDAARNAYTQNKLALAGGISSAGRPIAQDLIDRPGSSFGAVAGAWLKGELVSEAQWRAGYTRGHTVTAPSKVSPLVTCVSDHGDGTFDAAFGFDNPNDVDIDVPIGPDNQISPGPDSQGQPTEFDPGARESAFTIKGVTAAVRWTLQGRTVKASIAQSSKCSDVQPPEQQP